MGCFCCRDLRHLNHVNFHPVLRPGYDVVTMELKIQVVHWVLTQAGPVNKRKSSTYSRSCAIKINNVMHCSNTRNLRGRQDQGGSAKTCT